MTNAEKLTLKKHACHIRMGVIEGTHSAGCGHPGGSLSIADVLSYLYFKELNIDPAQPRMADRDRLVLSKDVYKRQPPPYLWTPPTPQRAKGYTPLTILKKKSKHKKASAAPVGAIALTLFSLLHL